MAKSNSVQNLISRNCLPKIQSEDPESAQKLETEPDEQTPPQLGKQAESKPQIDDSQFLPQKILKGIFPGS
jgi:parvulin-like peptidyl-prolyl isomerase